MAVVNKKEYAVRFTDDSTKSVVAKNMKVVTDTYETDDKPIAQITRVRTLEDVTDDPVLPVAFSVVVTPTPAADAGCLGTPASFTVEDGESVIFQAIPVTGFSFVGWYKGAALITADSTTRIQVTAPAIAGQTVQYEAKFVAVP